MAKREEPRTERAGWRVVQQWRTAGVWHATQDDYGTQREAWAKFFAAREALSNPPALRGVVGDDGQVDLYDLARGEVLETARAGPVLIDASHVLTKAELGQRLRTLFGKPEPTTDEGEAHAQQEQS